MGNRKITITVDEDLYRELNEAVRPMGFNRVSNLIRRLAVKGIHRDSKSVDRKTIEVSVDNYEEIKGYVGVKRLGDIGVFAAFAMEQYMTRYPLKTVPKSRDGKSIGD
jgi:predicted CopG family antitoxin